MSSITFSVIITFYNQSEFIKDALESVLSQRTAELEIIVVDDGSRDGSQDILKQYENETCLICLDTNQGFSQASNCGASLATGKYLVFLDGDDAFVPGAFDVYRRIVDTKKPKMILGSMKYFTGACPHTERNDTSREIQIAEYRNFCEKDRAFDASASAIVIDRESFLNVRGWADILTKKVTLTDFDLLMRLGDAGPTVHILSPPTIYHRIHARNSVHDVPPFITAMYEIIRDERSGRGRYPGGKGRRRERYGVIGGRVLFWTKRALRAGLYWDALKLLVLGWPMALIAVTRRLTVLLIKGRRPSEIIEL